MTVIVEQKFVELVRRQVIARERLLGKSRLYLPYSA